MSYSENLKLITTRGFSDYELLDCGDGRKLERFGGVVVNRPEPQALWPAIRGPSTWDTAHAVFSASGEDDEKGKWRVDQPVPEAWPVRIPCGAGHGEQLVTVHCKLSGLWHLGLFPEQHPHWQWMLERIETIEGEPARVLNLFGYTGAASLLAAAAGAEVTHVDASKKAIAWARENQSLSDLSAAKIRWLVEDCAKYVAREVRRGKTYHVILVDPPKFGRGPTGEVWDLFQNLAALLRDCEKLLVPERSAMVLTVYAIRASSLAFDQLMRTTLQDRGGHFDTGELAIVSGSGSAVPTSLFVRWVADA